MMAFGNATAERNALESTYEDTATVYRMTSVQGDNNIARTEPVAVYTDIICGLSYKSDSSRLQDQAQTLDVSVKLFAGPEHCIQPGDRVAVKRFGRDNPASTVLLTFSAVGKPVLYATHQEINLEDGDLA